MTTTTRRMRVQNLRAGDIVRRETFGTKTVLGLRRYIKRGRPDARIVKYDDGTASLFAAARVVDVVTQHTVNPAAERAVEQYSELKWSSRTGDPVKAAA